MVAPRVSRFLTAGQGKRRLWERDSLHDLWVRHAILLPHERLLKRMGILIRPITAHFPIKAANFEP